MSMFGASMTRLMDRILCSCTEVTELVSASMDRDLPWYHRLRLQAHFLICVLCSRYRDHVHFIRAALRAHPERLEDQDLPLPAALSPDVRERIKRAISQS